MRPRTSALFLIFAVVAAVIFISASCDNTGNGDSYYISFNFSDEEYEYTLGLTEVEEHAWVSQVSAFSEADLYFFAAPNVETGLTEPDDYMLIIVINVEVDAIGSYTTVNVYYRKDGITYTSTTASVEITVYGAVDETVEGTFSATVNAGGPSIEITNGSFRTKRIADNTYAPFD